MRISTSMLNDIALNGIESDESALSNTENQLSTGLSINSPADNPAGEVELLQLTTASTQVTQYTSNGSSATSNLDLEEIHVQNMFKHLPAQNGWTSQVDLSPLFFRLTLDSATEFLFGDSVESQLEGLPDAKHTDSHTGRDPKDFAYSFDRGQWYLAKASRYGDLW